MRSGGRVRASPALPLGPAWKRGGLFVSAGVCGAAGAERPVRLKAPVPRPALRAGPGEQGASRWRGPPATEGGVGTSILF